MEKEPASRSHPLLWFVTIVIVSIAVVWIFLTGYKKGVSVGVKTPPKETPAIKKVPQIDMRKLRISTPELVGTGKALFQINCASCHGDEGRGDGPRAAELNPRPRNFKAEKFKFGAAPIQVFNTITNGSPGTSMPSFALLPAQDRWALAHYVRTHVHNPPDDSPEEIAKLPGGEAGVQTSMTVAPDVQTEVKTGPRIPIKLAMQKLAVPETDGKKETQALERNKGYILYTRNCATCHGAAGDGRETIDLLRLNPYAYVKSRDLRNAEGMWLKDRSFFAKTVRLGPPSHLMPGFKTFTDSELDLLYGYIKNLATVKNNSQ